MSTPSSQPPFAQLTHRGQLRRLRALALLALEAYPLTDFRLSAIQHRDNATFRVRTDRGHFLLRLARAAYKDAATVRSEMRWLEALARDTDLRLPRPLKTRDGDLLAVVRHPGVPQPRVCVLTRWVEGRFHGQKRIKPLHLERVGRLSAALHRHAETFEPPAGFVRPRWDFDGLFGGSLLGGTLDEVRALLDASRRCTVDRAARRYRSALRRVGQRRGSFGLIHADLHQMNYLFSGGRAHPIDFDDCGWGYYLADIGGTLGALSGRRDFADLREAFLRGYLAARPLSCLDRSLLSDFVAGDRLRVAAWMAGSAENAGLRPNAARFVADRVNQIERLLPARKPRPAP